MAIAFAFASTDSCCQRAALRMSFGALGAAIFGSDVVPASCASAGVSTKTVARKLAVRERVRRMSASDPA